MSDERALLGGEALGLRFGKEQLLVPGDTAKDDIFGTVVALSGDTALIGTPGAEIDGTDLAGAAYVFVRDGNEWAEQQKLVAADESNLRFGRAVALSGDIAAVSGEDGVTVFVRTGSIWGEQDFIAGSNRFGYSLALDGDTLAVGDGDYTSVQVFRRNASDWDLEGDLPVTANAISPDYGGAIAISGDLLVAGSPLEDSRGLVHTFVRTGTDWSEETPVQGPGTDEQDFGTTVALVGETLLASMHKSPFVYERVGGFWIERARLEPAGLALAMTEERIATRSLGEDTAEVVLYVRNGTSWTLDQRLSVPLPGQAQAGDIALTDDTLLVGSNAEDEANDKIPGGAARVFALAVSEGDACSDDAECASEHCVSGVCCDSACDGSCETCTGADGAAKDGVCTVRTAGSPGIPTCGAETCDGVHGDCSGCSDDTDCPTDRFCAVGGLCEVRRVAGQACDLRAGDCANLGCRVCEEGACVDGVCCDSACDGGCEACTRALKGSGADGECGPIDAGADPENECTDSGAASCSTNGWCDGTGDCQLYPSTDACEPEPCESAAECTSFHCVDGVCCDRACDESEACSAELKVSGEAGTCGPAKTGALGRACDDDSTCTSGHCADGVCCDEACDGTCQACSAELKGEGDDGTCGLVAEGTNPERSSGFPHCEDEAACSTPVTCNSQGRCACDTGASCTDDVTLETSDGTEDCTPYACFGAACRASCNDSTDCAPGYRCTADGRCVTATPAAPSSDDGGCGCRTAGSARSDYGWVVAVVGIALGALRRRRRAAPSPSAA